MPQSSLRLLNLRLSEHQTPITMGDVISNGIRHALQFENFGRTQQKIDAHHKSDLMLVHSDTVYCVHLKAVLPLENDSG